MPNTAQRVTDSWRAYEECLKTIDEFLSEIRVKGGEAWIDEVCLGSSDQPWVRAPVASAALIGRSLARADAITSRLTESIQKTIETTRREMDKLKAEGEVDRQDSDRLSLRTKALEGLLVELTRVAARSPVSYHPVTLIHWSEILAQRVVPGNPAVPVRVVTTYVL